MIAGSAGAAGGYVVRDQGYVVQSPIKKEQENKSTGEKESADKTDGSSAVK